MEMTASQSLRDPHMVYLDIAAGLGGLVLYNLIEGNRKFSKLDLKLVVIVLISRLIVDFIYSVMISDTDSFGGSNMEFIASSVLWFVIITSFMSVKREKAFTMYGSTVLVMLAVARITHWG